MYKIGKLTKMYNISRTTLLYYDSINLLKPSARSKSNYRLYNDEDVKRLELICAYREMGIELNAIKGLLNENTNEKKILEIALMKLENKIKAIRHKQQKIIEVLQNIDQKHSSRKDVFTDVLKKMGMSESDMMNFHAMFEERDTQGHRVFLEFLGLSNDEIEEVIKNIN